MTIRKMDITPHSKFIIRQLNGIQSGRCGLQGSWKVNETQDVTKTGGCLPLGLKVPSKENEIIKLEINEFGEMNMFLGQTPTKLYTSKNSKQRPTSWGPQLKRCVIKNKQTTGNKDKFGTKHNLILPNQEARISTTNYCHQTKTYNLFSLTFGILCNLVK